MAFLRRFIDSRLQPPYLAAASGAVVVVGLALTVALFATSNRGRTAFGIPLGADFAGFYVAASILNRGETQQLYDRTLHHRLYHELLPDEDSRETIPYVHPPFVAGLLRPLAWLPYPLAVAIWLVISAGLYIATLRLLLKVLPWPNPNQKWLVVLLAVSFEPFLYECWMGGQLSAIAFCSFGLCFACLQRSRPISAGMALGICFYKPTLLLLLLPLLVIGRRWRILLGMSLMGLVLVAISLLLVGWTVNVGYLNVLLSFQSSTSGGDLEIRTWKYVDINNCLRLLLGPGSSLQLPLLVTIGAIPFGLLGWIWWKYPSPDEECGREIWSATITWIPVLNLYFGIYDSILVVQSIWIVATSLVLRSKSPTPLTSSGFAYLLWLIYAAPWFSQNLANLTGLSVYTGLLIVLGTCQFRRIAAMREEKESVTCQ